MKKETKKILFAFLTLLLTVALCVALVGCNKKPGETTESSSTPLGTLPPEDGSSTTGGDGSSTPSNTTASGTTATTNGGAVEPPLTGDYTNPLTGQPTNNNLANTRPLAIVVDNVANSYARQTGLDQADVLYETLVAPGITRFLMVVADYTKVDSVCNIRSGRDYHLDLAAFHNAVLMCHGGSVTNNYDFYQLVENRLGNKDRIINTLYEAWFCQAESGAKYGTIAHRGERKDLQYDTLFKPAALTALLNSKNSSEAKYQARFVRAGGSMDGAATQSLKFVAYGTSKSMAGASNATNVTLHFTCQGATGTKLVSFQYSSAMDKYLRSQDGTAHVDAETGKQLAFTNVIVLFTDVWNVETGISNDPNMARMTTRGSGIGYYFYGGKVINITWSSLGNGLTLLDSNNNELQLATGNTYIGYLDSGYIANGTPFWN